MGILGDFTRGLVILTGVLWAFTIIALVAMGQTILALFLLIVLMIPLTMIALEYLRNRKK